MLIIIRKRIISSRKIRIDIQFVTYTQAVKDNFDNCASKTASRPGSENSLDPQVFFPIYISTLSHTKTYTTCKLTGGSGGPKLSMPQVKRSKFVAINMDFPEQRQVYIESKQSDQASLLSTSKTSASLKATMIVVADHGLQDDCLHQLLDSFTATEYTDNEPPFEASLNSVRYENTSTMIQKNLLYSPISDSEHTRLKDGENTRNSFQQAASSTAGFTKLRDEFCNLFKAKQNFATDVRRKRKMKKKRLNLGYKKKGNTSQNIYYYDDDEFDQRITSAFKPIWLTVPLKLWSEETMMTVTVYENEKYYSAYWRLRELTSITTMTCIYYLLNLCKKFFSSLPIGYDFPGWKKIETSFNELTLTLSQASSKRTFLRQSLTLHLWMEDNAIAMTFYEVGSFINYQDFWLKRNETTIIHDWYCFFLWFQVLWRRCILFYWNTLHCCFKHRNQCIQVFIIFSGTCHDFSVDFLSFYNLAQCSEDGGVFDIDLYLPSISPLSQCLQSGGVFDINIYLSSTSPFSQYGGEQVERKLVVFTPTFG